MKKLFFFIFMILCCSAFSQNRTRNFTFSIKTGYLSVQGLPSRTYYGLDLDIALGEIVGIHYSLLFGRNYVHMPLGPVGGLLALANSYSEGSEAFGWLLLSLLIPEGISINFPVSQRVIFSPYISPLQFDFLEKEEPNLSNNHGIHGNGYGSIGLKINFDNKQGNIRAAPFAEHKIHYKGNVRPGWSAGITIGYRF